MAAFIVVDITNHQINTLVLKASNVPRNWCLFGDIQRFTQVLEDFFEILDGRRICILWNSIFDLPIWMSSPLSSFLVLAGLADPPLRTSVLMLAELADPPRRTSFLMLEDSVTSCCLS